MADSADGRGDGTSELQTVARALSDTVPLLVERLSKARSEEHTSELQSRFDLVCRLLLEKKNYVLITFSFPSFSHSPMLCRPFSAPPMHILCIFSLSLIPMSFFAFFFTS